MMYESDSDHYETETLRSLIPALKVADGLRTEVGFNHLLWLHLSFQSNFYQLITSSGEINVAFISSI